MSLQADNWNDKRKENEFTKELIFELKGNLETNLKSLDDNLQFEIKHLKYNRDLVDLINSKGNCEDFKNADYKWIPHFNKVNLEKSAYNTFKSHGFSNIKSKELRSKLISLYETTYPGVIDKTYEISKSRYESVSLNIQNSNFFYDVNSESWTPYNCDSLFSDKEFKSFVSFEIEWKKWRIHDTRTGIESTEKLLNLVDSILESDK